MTRCPITTSCGYPQGECSGLCLHRACINTDTMTKPRVSIKGKVEQRMPIDFAGPEPEDIPTEKQMTRFRFALNTFRLYRRWGCSVRQSLKRAAHEFRKFHTPDPFKEQA